MRQDITITQKIFLIETYLELDFKEKSASELNLLLANSGILFSIPKSKKKDDKAFQRQHLMSIIFDNIKGEEFYSLLKNDVYLSLDAKYKFNASTQNRVWYCESLQNIISHFYRCEVSRSKKLALKDSLMFCLFIVTIPFVKLYYDSKKYSYINYHQFFKSYFVDAALFSIKSKNNKTSSYGLIAKNMNNLANPNFQDIIFSFEHEENYSKKCNIRKLVISEEPVDGRAGLTLLGTRDQIFKADKRDPYKLAWVNLKQFGDEVNFKERADFVSKAPAMLKEHLPEDISQMIVDYSHENVNKDVLREGKNKEVLDKINKDVKALTSAKAWHVGLFGFAGRKTPYSIARFNLYMYFCLASGSNTKTVCELKILFEKALSSYSFTRSKQTKIFYKNILAELENAEPTLEIPVKLGC